MNVVRVLYASEIIVENEFPNVSKHLRFVHVWTDVECEINGNLRLWELLGGGDFRQ